MRHIAICGSPSYLTFLQIISKRHDFQEKSYRTQNARFHFLYNFCLKHFSLEKELSEI